MTICTQCRKYQQCPAKPADTCKSFEASSPSRKEKFTPGPWKYVRVQPEIDTFAIRTKSDDTLAVVGVSPVGWRPGKDIENAALIAAAPKMYALLDKCESALRHWLVGSIDDPMIGETENTINEIRKLLAEARGEK